MKHISKLIGHLRVYLKRTFSLCIGRTKGRLNTKLYALCNGDGKPLTFVLTEGQVSDHKGAKMLLGSLPQAQHLLVHRGYGAA